MTRAIVDIKKETPIFSARRTFARELVRVLSGCASILDVGCGGLSPVRFVPHARLTGVDAWASNIEQAKTFRTHDEFFHVDARKLMQHFGPDQFDACVALDVIEHFTKSDGHIFLRDLERIARKKVVVFTPNGFCPQSSREEGDFQEHLSGWEPDEMRMLGYHVIGLSGWKKLRTESHKLLYHPRPFWALVSWCTQHLWCRKCPETAAAILCWKEK